MTHSHEQPHRRANHGPLPCSAHRVPVVLCTVLWLSVAGTGSLPAADGVNPASPYTKQPPGVVITHQAAATRQYLGSPALAILPSGEYLASHDFFGPGSSRDRTQLFASSDRGQSWKLRSSLVGQWWSSLFVHRGAVYILGTSKEYGQCVIRRSMDAGQTWTEPRDEQTGLLLAEGKYHCAPVPVVEFQGRLWRAMEDAEGPGGWGSHFRAFVMSAPVDADLLKASSWQTTNRIARDPHWLGGKFGGWLEGNVVVTPDQQLVNLLRVENASHPERIARLTVGEQGRTLMFDPAKDFIPFPGGAKKFTIRFDAKSGRYISLVNAVPATFRNRKPASTRNTLVLASSADLNQWELHQVVLSNPDPVAHGYQYVDWLFDDADLAAVVRTAHDDGIGGAHNQHDSNLILFVRVPDFRAALAKKFDLDR